ncbi:ribosomal protein S14 mitochondrial [Populus alba x Populus x berolinensis]|nr:ribosomal protein S14 mitochondrial [Populus alba x Populus x berolinensis]
MLPLLYQPNPPISSSVPLALQSSPFSSRPVGGSKSAPKCKGGKLDIRNTGAPLVDLSSGEFDISTLQKSIDKALKDWKMQNLYLESVLMSFAETIRNEKEKISIGRSLLVKMEVRKENRNIRDNHRRLLAEKFELKRNLYKALVRDPTLPQEMRELHAYKLAKLPRNSSFTRVRNRCVFTGRPRGVYQLFRMSRLVFRSLASQGLLEGIRKASW